MVLIVFEGCDNLGKTTLVDSIVSDYRSQRDIVMIHSMGPGKNVQDPFEYQKEIFFVLASKIQMLSSFENSFVPKTGQNIVLLDRSWFGEYVYGQIYRNEPPEEINRYVIDRCCSMVSRKDNVYPVVVHLDADTGFIMKMDDGYSFSSDMVRSERLKHIDNERMLFDETFARIKENSASKFKYMKVKVDKDGEFRPKDELLNEIYDTIENKFGIEL